MQRAVRPQRGGEMQVQVRPGTRGEVIQEAGTVEPRDQKHLQGDNVQFCLHIGAQETLQVECHAIGVSIVNECAWEQG